MMAQAGNAFHVNAIGLVIFMVLLELPGLGTSLRTESTSTSSTSTTGGGVKSKFEQRFITVKGLQGQVSNKRQRQR
eukprot:12094958-Alexandrium_andersonii.AAC.1